jgi:hypothetical protein
MNLDSPKCFADEHEHCGATSLRPQQQSEEAHVVEDYEAGVRLLLTMRRISVFDTTYLAVSAVRFRSSSTSESVGMEGCAPTLVTDTAATAHPNRAASSGSMPWVSP